MMLITEKGVHGHCINLFPSLRVKADEERLKTSHSVIRHTCYYTPPPPPPPIVFSLHHYIFFLMIRFLVCEGPGKVVFDIL